MRIRFTKDSVYETGGPGVGPKFPKGTVLDQADVAKAIGLSEVSDGNAEAFLRRWVQRNVAEEVDGRSKPSQIEPSEEKAPDPEPKPSQKPVHVEVVQQPIGNSKRGEPTKGVDKP